MSSTNNGVNVPSRGSNGPSRGMAPPPFIAGSPPGNQPPVTNTIVQAFSKQRAAKDKVAKKTDAHADTCKRFVQFLAVPASYNDPLRTLSVDQLSKLTDADLMHQAFQVLTIDNLDGSLRLADGSISLKSKDVRL